MMHHLTVRGRPAKPPKCKKFGFWTFIRCVAGARWEVRCVCGKVVTRHAGSIRCGRSRSCGCRKEKLAKKSRSKRPFNDWIKKHYGVKSLRGVPEYRCWMAMKQRCYGNDPKNHRWKGRGIEVCERWLLSFEDFFHDVGFRPTRKHSLDRKRNNGHYDPSNCRWATPPEQHSNREVWIQRVEVNDAFTRGYLQGFTHGVLATRAPTSP